MNTDLFRRLPSAAMSLALATAVCSIPASAAAQPEPVPADEVDNTPTTALGGEATLRAEDATITRYEDKLVFEVRMDTPDPGTYIYPPEVPDERKAPPEVFTAWAFVFNYPEHCVGSDRLRSLLRERLQRRCPGRDLWGGRTRQLSRP